MSLKDKQSLIALLFNMARADGTLDEREVRFIFDTGKRIGISSGTIELIQYHPENYPLQVPKDENDRMIILYRLLFMMKIDNTIQPQEEALIHEVALRLGVRPELTSDFLQILQKHLADKVPVKDMIQAIKKYLN